MQSIIALLVLALSCLTTVRDNPSLPQPIKDQAQSFAQQLFIEATNEMASSTVASSTPLQVPVTISPMPEQPSKPAPEVASAPIPTQTPLTVYILKNENDPTLFYYAGDKNIANAKVGDADVSLTLTKHLPDDCIMVSGEKKCGYYVARFTAVAATPIVLTADDGSTYSGGLTQ